MNAAQRRKVILERLTEANAPLSASVLAGELGVSRQIVVGDVALLRASGTQIDATPRGYQLHPAARGYTGILACVHSTADQMREELYTVVDQGGIVVDVAVENPLYGELRGNLNLASRYDVDHFIQQAADTPECLLSRMTGGVHLHTLSSRRPLMVTASVKPRSARLSTWSFINDCRGEITTVSPCMVLPSIRAGNWKVSDLPPPVGNIANNDLPSTAACDACSCSGSPS